MPTPLGGRAERLTRVRALRTAKGRREQGRYAFEGPTLLGEALTARLPIEEVYATQAAYDASALARGLEERGVPCFIVDERTAAGISDVESPSGLLAITPMRFAALGELLALPGPVLLLADLNDPANAGTLLRSADAFGCRGVIFGDLGVEPYHPKVVRASMGAVFRLAVAVAAPAEAAAAFQTARRAVLGLASGGDDIEAVPWPADPVLAVGHERRGLGRWEGLCERLLAIPMSGKTESLSAAVAGSIGLFFASRRALREGAK